ncbi:hypothetical protein L0337_17745 [candidate division KSB1 bacterium]|nr:hypothetical protein [candidate division KSB1 bacterium]
MPDQTDPELSTAPPKQDAAGLAGNESPDAPQQRLAQIEREATVLAEAYRLRLVGRLWWANLMFVVLPAVFATAAAIFAAGPDPVPPAVAAPLAASLAGFAAVLTAIHKALKCEEYQTECLRLGPAYEAIAIQAGSAKISSDPDKLNEITEQFAKLTESAKAPLPNKYIENAKVRAGYKPCTEATPSTRKGWLRRLLQPW